MTINRNVPDWMTGEIRIDRSRFPYQVYLGGKHIGVLYTSYLIGVMSDAFRYSIELNRLREDKNDLINKLKLAGIDPGMEIEAETETVVREDPVEVMAMTGLAIGQIWQSRRGKHHRYRVTKVDTMKNEVSIEWIGEYEWTSTADIEKFKKTYDLVREADDG